MVSLEILNQEILLLRMLAVDFADHVFGETVLNAAALDFRDLVVRMGALNLVVPLHFLGLDDQSARLGLPVFSGRERDNEVGAFLSIGLKLAALRVASELCSGVWSEESNEVGTGLQVVRESEADGAGLLQG